MRFPVGNGSLVEGMSGYYVVFGSKLDKVTRKTPASRAKRQREENKETKAEGWLANPNRDGYGSHQAWPFNRDKAVWERGYRQGIERALENPLYADNWKYYANRLLMEVYNLIIQVNEAEQHMIADELEEFVERGDL